MRLFWVTQAAFASRDLNPSVLYVRVDVYVGVYVDVSRASLLQIPQVPLLAILRTHRSNGFDFR